MVNERLETERYYEELRQQLVSAIQDGNADQEKNIRAELAEAGFIDVPEE